MNAHHAGHRRQAFRRRIRIERVKTPFARLLMCAVLGVVCPHAVHADWPNFRGPHYDGISAETGLRTTGNKPPSVVWKRDVGSAFSSFATVGDRVYTCGTADRKQVLFCLNARDGSIIWQHPFEKSYRNEHGDGTRATPTVFDGRVYIQGAHGRLLCVDANDGREIWSKQFDHKPTWGYSASVLVEGDVAIAVAGDEQGSLAPFDRKTGQPKWTCGTDPAGYAMPYPFTLNGTRYVVGFTGKSAIIAEVGRGREVWRMPWDTDWDVNAAMPIVHDGYLLISSGYRTGAGLFKLGTSGDGLTAREVWRSKVLLNKFQSCLLYEGNLYTSDQKALKCVDFMTGERRWRVPRVKHGTLALAQGQLFLLTQDGELRIAPASPEGFSPTFTGSVLDGRCWSVPVIHQGRMFMRNLEHIVVLDLRD